MINGLIMFQKKVTKPKIEQKVVGNTSSSSSEDSSSLNSIITSLPSASISVLVFFFFGLGGAGGSVHIMGCQQREPSNGVGVNSTNKN